MGICYAMPRLGKQGNGGQEKHCSAQQSGKKEGRRVAYDRGAIRTDEALGLEKEKPSEMMAECSVREGPVLDPVTG